MTLKFDRWPRRTIGYLFYATASFVHHIVAICGFKLELQSGNTKNWGKICFDLCDLDIWLLILTSCRDITFVNGKNCMKFHDDTMTGTLCKGCHRLTDRWADRHTDGQKCSQLEIRVVCDFRSHDAQLITLQWVWLYMTKNNKIKCYKIWYEF